MKQVRKPRILFLAQLPPPVHGSALMNLYISESQKLKENFDIMWIDISMGDSLETIGTFTFDKLWTYAKIHVKLIWSLLSTKFSAVYITIAPFGIPFIKDSLLVLWIRLFSPKIIFHLHGKGIDDELNSSWLKKKYYNFIFRGSFVIHLSESLLRDIQKISTSKKIFILPNGIPGIGFKSENTEQIQILYLSNFFESKGALELLKAARVLVDQKIDFHLKLVGGWSDTKFKKHLFEYFDSFEWEGKVEIVGPLYGNAKMNVLKGSSILVFPSNYRMECFPLVILEAMSCGLAIVASKVGAIPEILENGKAGILIDPQNTQEFTSVLKNLIEDELRRKELKHNSLKVFTEKYSFQVFEKNLVEIIQSIIRN